MNRQAVAVLEDDVDTLEMYCALLKHAGYSVVALSKGAELFSLLAEQKPKAIIMDLGLPDARGVALCRAIRGHRGLAYVPIIAVTGWSSGAAVEGLGDAPFNEVFLKPIDPQLLLEALRRWGVGPAAAIA
jgi:DNA-binding response OmpR family regulator